MQKAAAIAFSWTHRVILIVSRGDRLPSRRTYYSYSILTNGTEREDTDEEDNAHPEQNETDDVAFVAKLRSSRTLASILKTIHFAAVSDAQKTEHTQRRVLVLQDTIFCASPTGSKSSSKTECLIKVVFKIAAVIFTTF